MQSSRAVVFIALATAFSLLGDQMLYAVVPTHYAAFGLMPYQVGLILSVNRWVRLVANTLAEKLCQRYSVTGLLIAALILGGALTAVYGVVTSFFVLLIARMLWGLSWSFIRQIGLMTVVETSPPAVIGQQMGYYNGISRLGSVGGNLGGGLAHDVIGFTVALFLFAIISLVGTPLGWLARRAVSRERGDGEKVEDAGWMPELMICGFVIGCVGPGIVMSTLGRGSRGKRGHISDRIGRGHWRGHLERRVVVFAVGCRRARRAFFGAYQRPVGAAMERGWLFWRWGVGVALCVHSVARGVVDGVRGGVFHVRCWSNCGDDRRVRLAGFALCCGIRDGV